MILSKVKQNYLKTLLLFVGILFVGVYGWSEWYNYIHDIIQQYDQRFTDDQTHNVIIVLGLFSISIIPLLVILLFCCNSVKYISSKLNWYADFEMFMQRLCKKEKRN